MSRASLVWYDVQVVPLIERVLSSEIHPFLMVICWWCRFTPTATKQGRARGSCVAVPEHSARPVPAT